MLRAKMIANLREHYKIADEKVLEVMNRVPRHFFVPEAIKHQAYKDNALPIEGKQTISQPFIVARMTELLELTPVVKSFGNRRGFGLSNGCFRRSRSEFLPSKEFRSSAKRRNNRLTKLGIKNVTLKCADGTVGWEVYAPFDGILVAAGSPEIPAPLVYQLKIGGKLVIPIGEDQKTQRLIRVTRTEKRICHRRFRRMRVCSADRRTRLEG